MSGTVLLVLGLAALMGALVLAAVAFAGGARGVEGGLVAIERQYGQHVAARPSLGARELSPLLDRLRLLAVRLSPGRFAGSLQRRLDLAGNPERWTVDRVLAFKALGLIGRHTSELQSRRDLVCRLLLEKKKKKKNTH